MLGGEEIAQGNNLYVIETKIKPEELGLRVLCC